MAPGTNIGAASPSARGGEDIDRDARRKKVMNDAIANMPRHRRGRAAAPVDWAVSTVRHAASVLGRSKPSRLGAVDGIAVSLDGRQRQANGPGRPGRRRSR
jgi:membrane-bound ClpP family serine protease